MASTELQNLAPGLAIATQLEAQPAARWRFDAFVTAFEMAADLISITIAALVAYGMQCAFDRRPMFPTSQAIAVAFAFAMLCVVLLDRHGGYRPDNSLLRIRETERALRVSTEALVFSLPVAFLFRETFPRFMLLAAALIPLTLVLEKQLVLVGVRVFHMRGYGRRRVLIYGAGYTGRRVFSALVRSPKLGLVPVGVVDDDSETAETEIFASGYRHVHSIPITPGPLTRELIQKLGVETVIIAIPSLEREKFAAVFSESSQAQASVAYVPGHSVAPQYWANYIDLDGLLLTSLGPPENSSWREFVKRGFDIVFALGVLALLSPALLLIAALVRLDSPGPAIFKQKRVGQNGKLFDLYKFRSMYTNAPQYGYSPKEAEDPRITPFGRWLRRSSVDEIPQLFNVLRGEMSIVGPRPEMPFIVARYNREQCQRLQVPPGLTGLWQLSADRAFLIHENLQYDLYYIRHRNFFMDLAIVLHTAVFAMRGI